MVSIGDETWELDQVTCGFGEVETGIEGAEVNIAASNGEVSLYLALEPDNSYIEFGEPEGREGSRQFTTLGGDDPHIEIDGRSVNARAGFYSYDDSGSAGEPVEGTVSADCAGGGSAGHAANPGGEAKPSDRPFEVERSDLGVALVSATGANDHEVHGDTIRLVFDKGSKGSPSAVINCSASLRLKGDADRVEVSYPDGTVDCADIVPGME